MCITAGLPPGDWPRTKDVVWLLTRYRMHMHLNSTLCLQLHKPHRERTLSVQDLYIALTCTKHVVLQYLS
jgi:hypothetical protein